MSHRLFLDLKQVVKLHKNLIEHYGGMDGIRDIGLLQSAIAMPQASYDGEYLHHDIFDMAAAYLYHMFKIIHFLMATSEQVPHL